LPNREKKADHVRIDNISNGCRQLENLYEKENKLYLKIRSTHIDEFLVVKVYS